MGWGGIIAQGALGALAGGAQSMSDDITARQKEAMETRRAEQLSRLRMQEHATNTQVSSDIAAKASMQAKDDNLAWEQKNGSIVNDIAAARTRSTVGATADATTEAATRNRAENLANITAEIDARAKAVKAAETPEQKAKAKADLDHIIAQTGLNKAQAAHAYAQAGLETAKAQNEVLKDPNAKADAAAKPVNEDTVDAGEDAKGRKMRRGKISGWKMIEDPGVKGKPEEKNVFSPNKPAVEAKNPRTVFMDPEGNERTQAEYEAALAGTGADRKAAAKTGIVGASTYAGQFKDIEDATAQARAAIAAGANRAIIAKRYKDATGKTLPF